MACCCRDFTKISSGIGVMKLDYTDGSVIWQHGFKAKYDTVDSPFGWQACAIGYYGLVYDPSANHLVCVARQNGSGTYKLLAFEKSGATKWLISDHCFSFGATTTSVITQYGPTHPIEILGGGNLAVMASSISGPSLLGGHPKITIVDVDGNITSQSADLATYFSEMNATTGYNIWKTGSDYICDKVALAKLRRVDWSGSSVWNIGAGQAIAGFDGTYFINGNGARIDPATGAFVSVVHPRPGFPTQSKYYAVNAGGNNVWWYPALTPPDTPKVTNYSTGSTYDLSLTIPSSGTHLHVFIDGSTAYVTGIKSISGTSRPYVESWDVSGTPSLNWQVLPTYSTNPNIQGFNIAVDDDSNVYVT